MCDQILDSNINVSRVELACVDCLASLVFAPSEVKLELAIVEHLMVSVERAQEDLFCCAAGLAFYHSDKSFDYEIKRMLSAD